MARTIVARRPRDIWSAPLHVDFTEILTGFAKGAAATYLGSPGSAAGSVIDALRKTKVMMKRDPGELAWMLVVAALVQAIRDAADEPPLRDRIAPEDLDAFAAAVAIFVGEHEWPLEKAFFSRPALPVVHDVAANFAAWLTAIGTERIAVKAAQRNVVDFFSGAIDAAWRDGEATWEPIRKALDMPFEAARRNDEAWRAYHDSLAALPNERQFGESFSLADIYVAPRCTVRRTSAQTTDAIFDAAAELDRWVEQTRDRDALRVISGEPGSGKSSFVAMYAARTAAQTDVDVLFIPLYLFELGEYLEESITRFAASAALADPFERSRRRLLLLFDGVDELEMQGRHGSEVARSFVERLSQLLRRRNTKGVRVLAVVTGREILIQSIGGVIDRTRLMILQPFYLPSPERFLGDSEIAKIDQRQEWWRRYGALKGKPYDGLPPQLAREELNDLTSQPLLNYLVALSFERGRVDFEAEPNLNAIYEDLVDAVYEREWAKVPHPVARRIDKKDFVRVLQEVAVTTWEGNGRTATVADVAERARRRGFESLLRQFAADCEAGLGRFLTVFYFRYRDERLKGERTFEFTHKTFGEYLTAKWLVAEARTFVPGTRDLLLHWLVAFGQIDLDAYLMRFFEREVTLLSTSERERIAICAQSVLDVALMYELPVHLLEPRPEYPDETAIIDNAGIIALALLSAVGRAQGVPHDLQLRDADDLAYWLRRVVVPDVSQFRPALHCLSYLRIISADFSNLDLWNAGFSHSALRDARFDHAMIEHADFEGCFLQKATFDGAVARGAYFEKADLNGTTMQDANFTEAEMVAAVLAGVTCLDTSFRDARLNGAVLRGAILRGCTFDRCWLDGADLSHAEVSGWVTGASFASAVFIGADLIHATFADCIFAGAIFRDTKASEATFRNCELAPEQLAGLILIERRQDGDS